MGMRAKTHARHDQVVIDDAQTAKAHPLGIIVIRETESVISVQPAMTRMAPFVCSSNFHHGKTMRPNSKPVKDHVSCLSITRGYARRHMELRHLRSFVAVAEQENVSRAALKLHVSQPGISRQIRDLEEELGFSLLQRSAKSVRLTEAGRVFLKEARAVLERANEAVEAARLAASGNGGELHIGS